MKRLFALAVVAIVLVPAFAFAGYNDVTLTTDAVISVGGYTLDVSGASATIESITVNTTNFSVTLASGSSFSVSSPTLQQLSSDVQSDVTNNTCTGSASSISLAYSGAGTVTNVITPSASICSGSSSTPAPSNAGGGGLIVGSGPLAPGYVNTHPTATPVTTSTQVSATTTLAASVSPIPVPAPAAQSTTSSGLVFRKNYQLWDAGDDIAALQRFLNSHGFSLVSTGWGSPGKETDTFGLHTYAALIKFQEAHGLPATGYLGPLTRGAINSL